MKLGVTPGGGGIAGVLDSSSTRAGDSGGDIVNAYFHTATLSTTSGS